ncbi:MAG: ATP-binding protein [Deltaproteobacteria bacterium]|nr:ATP-binding protein [Deltaproteobacteria bacterium]
MIERTVSKELKVLVGEYPVVTILGPRQSGKTTLAKTVLTDYAYSNLEIPETRLFATEDPKAYLAQFLGPVIIDEIQRVPDLLSYIQGIVDEENIEGRFVLTGSHQLQLQEAVTQSLAGRTAILKLLPFSIAELSKHSISFDNFEGYCFKGFLPRIYDKSLRPAIAYSNYYQTYVERDVRQMIKLKDLTLFEKLLKLMAGRVGQIIDYGSLSNDVGVDAKTIKNWLSILEASFVVFKLSPYFENFGKRVIKSPKYYFSDVGLLCFLLGIQNESQVLRDPLVGNIFENLVITDCLKTRYNQGEVPDLYYFRDSNGNEVDLVYQKGRELVAIEIKSATTFSSSQLKGLKRFKKIAPSIGRSFLIYNGESKILSDGIQTKNFKECSTIFI